MLYVQGACNPRNDGASVLSVAYYTLSIWCIKFGTSLFPIPIQTEGDDPTKECIKAISSRSERVQCNFRKFLMSAV